MPLHVSSTCAHHEEVKIALHSPWYYHTYRYDDARGCVMQFWPHDYEHMCSKHVEAWNKLMVKQKFCASSSLITEVNILRCTVSKTPKSVMCSASRFCFFSCHFAVYLHFEDAAERTKSFFFTSNAPHVLYGLRGLPSWAWQKCNRLLTLGHPWGAVTLSQWCEWWYRRM